MNGKTNHLILYLLSIIMLSSCFSARNQLSRGLYDKAIETSARKLQKKPGDQKHIDVLLEAYRTANQIDLDKIAALRTSNSEQNWEQIYRLYGLLNHRQNIVKQLPPLKPVNPLTNLDFDFRDYTQELAESRQKAGENHYYEGVRLLDMGDRFSARKAYSHFIQAQNYGVTFQDIDQKKQIAYDNGFTNILVVIDNKAPQPFPSMLEDYLYRLPVYQYNKDWIRYSCIDQKNFTYHYYIEIVLTDLFSGPDLLTHDIYTETATIEDGWEWEKNPDGSVRTDSLGNKIKRILYRDVVAKINRTEQRKESLIRAWFLLSPAGTDQPLMKEPIQGSSIFLNQYAFASGDNRALSVKSIQLLQQKPLPYPSHTEMMMLASQSFGNIVLEKVNQTLNLIR